MRRFLVQPLFLAIVALGVAIPLIRVATPTTAGPIDAKVQHCLGLPVLPKLKLREATLPEAIAVLNQGLANRPETAHLHFALWTQPDPPPCFVRRSPGAAGRGLAGVPPPVDPDARITISLTNVPVSDAARYIGTLSGCGPVRCQSGHTLYFVSERFLGPFVERTLTIHPQSPLASFHDAKALEGAFKRELGIELSEGSEMRFVAPDRLLIRTLADDMDRFDMYLRFDPTLGERLSNWKEDWRGELRRLMPRPPPTGPICHVGEPLNDSWDR